MDRHGISAARQVARGGARRTPRSPVVPGRQGPAQAVGRRTTSAGDMSGDGPQEDVPLDTIRRWTPQPARRSPERDLRPSPSRTADATVGVSQPARLEDSS